MSTYLRLRVRHAIPGVIALNNKGAIKRMLKIRDRAVRFIAALALAGLVATQIPVTGNVALAQNGYESDVPGEGDDNPNKVVVGGMLLITAYGLIVELTDKD